MSIFLCQWGSTSLYLPIPPPYTTSLYLPIPPYTSLYPSFSQQTSPPHPHLGFRSQAPESKKKIKHVFWKTFFLGISQPLLDEEEGMQGEWGESSCRSPPPVEIAQKKAQPQTNSQFEHLYHWIGNFLSFLMV